MLAHQTVTGVVGQVIVDETTPLVFDDHHEQFRLRRGVLEHGAGGDVGALGHLGRRHALVPHLTEQALGSREDAGLLVSLVACATTLLVRAAHDGTSAGHDRGVRRTRRGAGLVGAVEAIESVDGVADAAVALRGSVMDRNLTRAERPWWHRKK